MRGRRLDICVAIFSWIIHAYITRSCSNISIKALEFWWRVLSIKRDGNSLARWPQSMSTSSTTQGSGNTMKN